MCRDKLTPKEQVFVQEFLVDLCIIDAARRAGYKNGYALKSVAWQVYHRPRVQAAIQAALAERSKRTQITADRVLQELARIAFSDMGEFAEWDANGFTLRDSSELSEDARRAVSELGQTVTKEGGSIRFKLHDKVSALEKLAKHTGILVEKSINITEDVTNLTPEERKVRIDELIRKRGDGANQAP